MQELRTIFFHHIGFAVRSMRDSRTAFEALGAKFYHTVYDKERNLDFSFATMKGSNVIFELISPHDPSRSSTVDNMVKKQPCTQYHVCFLAKEISEEIKRLKQVGFKQISKIHRTYVHGKETIGAFLFSAGTGVIELIQECEKNGTGK